MDIVIPDVSLGPALVRFRNLDVRYHLFNNNHTVTKATVLASFAEPTVAGYASIAVAIADWSVPVVTTHFASSFCSIIMFIANAGLSEDCYGYYVTDDFDTELLWAANFDGGPVALTDLGLPVLPIIGDSSRFG